MAGNFTVFDCNVSPNGDWVVGVRNDGLAKIIEPASGIARNVGRLHWDTGGRRVAVSSKRGLVLSGAYAAKGVACYDARDGRRLWFCHAVRRIHSIEIDEQHEHCYVVQDNQACKILQLVDGEVIDVRQTCDTLSVYPLHGIVLASHRRTMSRLAHHSAVPTWQAAMPGITLCVTVTASVAYVGIMGGPLIALSADTGAELWRFGEAHSHYCEAAACDGMLYAIRYRYTSPTETFIDQFNLSGTRLAATSLGDCGTAGRFVLGGRCLFMYRGDLLDARTARCIRRDLWNLPTPS